jgi:hypothetical protein
LQANRTVVMANMNCAIEDLTVQSEPSPDPAVIASAGSELQCRSLRLLSPADPLTRLLMKADGVSEAYLDALVQKIAKQRG